MSKTLTVRVPLPAPSTVLGANLAGLLGLIAVTLAVGGLAGNWWWSILVGGAFAVALAYIASTHVEEPEPAAQPARLRTAS